MNDKWVKVDDLIEVNDLAERIQEIEQAKEMWKSILDNYTIQYKFEIRDSEDQETDRYCIRNVYILELWVTESYYQMAKEIVEEVKNAPLADDSWELQNEVPIEEKYEEKINEHKEIPEEIKNKQKSQEKIVMIIWSVSIIVVSTIFYGYILVSLLSRPTKDINAIFATILLFIATIALIVGLSIIVTKKEKKE